MSFFGNLVKFAEMVEAVVESGAAVCGAEASVGVVGAAVGAAVGAVAEVAVVAAEVAVVAAGAVGVVAAGAVGVVAAGATVLAAPEVVAGAFMAAALVLPPIVDSKLESLENARENSTEQERKRPDDNNSNQVGRRDPADSHRDGSEKGLNSLENSSGNQQEQSTTDNSNQGGGRDPDDRRNGSEKKKECQGATITEQLWEFNRIVEKIEEFKRLLELFPRPMSDAELLNRINRLHREFISAAVPLMNDPTIQMSINSRGGLEIVTASGNQVGISRHQANLLSRAIHEEIVYVSDTVEPCYRSSCRYCPNLRRMQSERTGDCDTRRVIYCIYCNDCARIVYVGQTTQRLRVRIYQHLNNEKSGPHRHIANNPGHRVRDPRHWSPMNILDTNIFDIIIMWTTNDVHTDLDDSSIKRIIRNWEVLSQWMSEAHKSQGGESKR